MALSPLSVTMARVVPNSTQLNSTRLLSLCAVHSLSVLGSWFKRKDIYGNSWICNDRDTRKELESHMANDRSFFKSIRVFRGAEPPANSDHRLVCPQRLFGLI